MPERTVEISITKTLRLVIVIVVVIAATLLLLGWNSQQNTPTGTATPTEERDPAAVLAEEATIAFRAVDYRDPEGWRERIRPLCSDYAVDLFENQFMELVWPVFEEKEWVVTPEQIVVEDLGAIAQDGDWQVRLVSVVVSDPPPMLKEGVFEDHVLIIQEGGEWKFKASLTDEEYNQMYSQHSQ